MCVCSVSAAMGFCVGPVAALFLSRSAVIVEVFTDFNIAAECVQRVWDASQHAGNVLHSHCLPVCGWLPFALLASLQMSDIRPACSFHFWPLSLPGFFPFPARGISRINLTWHCQRVKRLANAAIKPMGLIKLIANCSNEGIFFMLPLFGGYVTTFRGLCYDFSGGMLPLFGGFGRAFVCGLAMIMPYTVLPFVSSFQPEIRPVSFQYCSIL